MKIKKKEKKNQIWDKQIGWLKANEKEENYEEKEEKKKQQHNANCSIRFGIEILCEPGTFFSAVYFIVGPRLLIFL